MALDTEEHRRELIKDYPGLRNDPNFKITSHISVHYNCIAWAMGFNDRRVDIEPGAGNWWPEDVSKDVDKDTLVKAFESLGFVKADHPNIEDGYDKVSLYGYGAFWSHAAKICEEGVEHSKFGNGWDGKHSSNIFRGSDYGEIFCYMKRPIKDRCITENVKQQKGKIKINLDLLADLK